MGPNDLLPHERQILLGLVTYLVGRDRVVEPGEVEELRALSGELGEPITRTTLEAALERYPTLDAVVDAAGDIERDDARELIRTLLMDLAQADGQRERGEYAVIARIIHEWARS